MNIKNIKIKDIMNKNVICVDINTSIHETAKIMTKNNIGFIPILNKDKLVGVVTDRDIINRIISKEKNINDSISIAMSTNIISAEKCEDISIAITKMADNQIRRIVILNKKKELVGILSLSDIANHKDSKDYLPELIYEILLPNITDLFLVKPTEVLV